MTNNDNMLWRTNRAKLVHDARAVIDTAEAEGRTMDAEERQRVDTMLDDAEALRGDIERFEKAAATQDRISEESDRRSETRLAPHQRTATDERPTIASDEYRTAFDNYIRRGRSGLSPDEHRALQVGTNSEGGYLAPVVENDSANLQATIVETIDAAAPMMELATVINVSGDLTIPTESSIGAADWTAEEAAFNESDAAFGVIRLQPHKATTLVKVSSELLSDSAVNLESYLGNLFGRRFATLINAGTTVGDGSNKPTGIDSGAQSIATCASATAVTFDELIQLYYGNGNLKDGYRRAGTWMFSTATAQSIRQLKDGDDRYLWEASVMAGEPDTLLGRPVAINDDVADMATNTKAIFFGDMSYYWIAMSQAVTLQRVDELYAANGQVGLLASVRLDGELTTSDAVKYLTMA